MTKSLLEKGQISSKLFVFKVGLSGLGLGGRNLPTKLLVSDSKGGNPTLTTKVVGSGGEQLGSGHVRRVGWLGQP